MSVDTEVYVRDATLRSLANYNPATALRKMEAYWLREIGQMFESEGRSRGHAWQPLSPQYAAWKRRAGKSPKTLHLTGGLRASFITLERGPDYFVFGASPGSTDGRTDNREKAIWHDRGAGTNPERPLIRPIARDFETLHEFIRQDLARQGRSDE